MLLLQCIVCALKLGITMDIDCGLKAVVVALATAVTKATKQ